MVSLASYWIGSEEESAVREPFPPHPSREEREFVREVPVLVCVTGGMLSSERITLFNIVAMIVEFYEIEFVHDISS